ncbi:MAG: hypothetical protein M3R70_02370 [Actinomycetota bacterium]|nr:hypothetical protein [Actinomycetota bacterium]
MYRPRQLAPLLVVQTAEPKQLADATGAILSSLDPKARTTDDRTGWAFEGFYFEARDGNGRPAFVTFNYWRGSIPGGGQWARSESLYPFAHG